jgi:hypothetical protein
LNAVRAPLLVKLILVTALTLTFAFCAVASVRIRGLTPRSFIAAQVIQQRCPFHLVNPANIPGRDQADILNRWTLAEVRARVAVISCLWGLAALALFWNYWRNRQVRGARRPT